MNYAKRCKFHDVIVRGRRCEATDHPDGRRTYMAWHEGVDKLREVPQREAKLRAEIDAAIAAKAPGLSGGALPTGYCATSLLRDGKLRPAPASGVAIPLKENGNVR